MTLWQDISTGDYSPSLEECSSVISYRCSAHEERAYLYSHYLAALFHRFHRPVYLGNFLFLQRKPELHQFLEHGERSLALAEHLPNPAQRGQCLHTIPQGLGNINHVSGNREQARCNGEYAMRTGKKYAWIVPSRLPEPISPRKAFNFC